MHKIPDTRYRIQDTRYRITHKIPRITRKIRHTHYCPLPACVEAAEGVRLHDSTSLCFGGSPRSHLRIRVRVRVRG